MGGRDSIPTLILGAGITGLATAAALPKDSVLVLEKDSQMGGYCKTIHQDGFVWDYSGHFFHFKHPDIEAWLRARMGGQQIRTVQKQSFIRYAGKLVDFPFQKNIHQLPLDEFLECLHDLYFAQARSDGAAETNFKDMLRARFGAGICDKFLFPYNEKLYACDLASLDKDAMGRFFPHASLTDIVRNFRTPDNSSYNQTFTYPMGGAYEYVKAIASEVRQDRIYLDEPAVRVDLERKEVQTPRRTIAYDRLVSTLPLPRLLELASVPHDSSVFSWNKVLVFNLGFDRKGPRNVHWIYYPDRGCVFYRVGFYDNIFDTARMSLYVEIGLSSGASVSAADLLPRVLTDLKNQGVVTDQTLVSHHCVLMDPAYVHITQQSLAAHARLAARLEAQNVYSIGRYGRWTYCSIEDNIIEARALASTFR